MFSGKNGEEIILITFQISRTERNLIFSITSLNFRGSNFRNTFFSRHSNFATFQSREISKVLKSAAKMSCSKVFYCI